MCDHPHERTVTSGFKIGELVEIVGPSDCHGDNYRGQKGEVRYPAAAGNYGVALEGNVLHYFPASSLRPVPTFKAGDRVRATQDSRPTWLRSCEGIVATLNSGYDARYIAVDFSDGRSPSHYEADELELLPEKRVPKVGEVWAFQGSIGLTPQPIYFIGKGMVNLNDHARIPCDQMTLEWAGNSPVWSFLADSLTAYFKALP